MGIPRQEAGDTKMYTWQSSVAPDAAPLFSVQGIAGTVIASFTALTSDSTHYYAIYTYPTSEGYYRNEWLAVKTINGSARNLIIRDTFKVEETQRPS